MMQIITLTTDAGLKDHYVASIKASLYRQLPNVILIDISHDIRPFDSSEAAFQLRSCYTDFPDGTIHIIGVDSEPKIAEASIENNQQNFSPNYPSILVFENQYFIATDNGFFGAFLGDKKPSAFYNYLAIHEHLEMLRFTTKTCLAPLAIRIAKGEKAEQFCTGEENFKRSLLQNPIIEALSIQGHVIHIDSYGNLISNITKEDFDRFGENMPFTIYYHNKTYHLEKISPTYNSVILGDKVAIFNHAGLLEIAINQGANKGNGGADRLFGVRKGDVIRVDFEPAGSHKTINTLAF